MRHWFCPICLIHLIGRKCLNFEKKTTSLSTFVGLGVCGARHSWTRVSPIRCCGRTTLHASVALRHRTCGGYTHSTDLQHTQKTISVFFLFLNFWLTHVLCVGPLIPLFWASNDVSSGFQSQGGFPSLASFVVCVQRNPQIHLWCDTC